VTQNHYKMHEYRKEFEIEKQVDNCVFIMKGTKSVTLIDVDQSTNQADIQTDVEYDSLIIALPSFQTVLLFSEISDDLKELFKNEIESFEAVE